VHLLLWGLRPGLLLGLLLRLHGAAPQLHTLAGERCLEVGQLCNRLAVRHGGACNPASIYRYGVGAW
jgi:hypothetical protein